MKKRIAVEAELSNVRDFLEGQGYSILEFQHNEGDAEEFEDVDAIVMTGMDENMLGMEDIETEAVVINASGMTPEEIANILEQRL